MRGLSKFASSSGSSNVSRNPFLSTYSTFSPGGGGGGGGSGRGRGRGFGVPLPVPPRVLGEPDAVESDRFIYGTGRGRGGADVPQPPPSPSPSIPHVSSLISSLIPPSGRGRGRAPPPPAPTGEEATRFGDESAAFSKKPIFFNRDEAPSENVRTSDPADSFIRSVSKVIPGTGRGKVVPPASDQDSRPGETDRHRRPRVSPPSEDSALAGKVKLSREDAVKKAVQALSRGGPSQETGDPARRGGRVSRGRGKWGRTRGGGDATKEFEVYLGDNADGEKLEKRLGEEKLKQLVAAFEESSRKVLPSPIEEAYLDALHTNNLIEYEPEYLVNFENPDIDETPPMSLEEYLATAKPFLIAYEGMQSQEEWETAIKELMETVPHLERLMDMYCGPDRITAKQQIEELERVAKTLPESAPSSVKRFTDRAVLSLQSNPGWRFDKKCEFMNRLVREVSQQYK